MDVRVGWILLILVASAGCVADPAGVEPPSPVDLEGDSPVVIAVIDSGTNPYLPIFSSARTVPTHWSVEPAAVALVGVGTVAERVGADSSSWAPLVGEMLYHVEGTRLLSISFDPGASGDGLVMDKVGHGAMTTFLAAREAPTAWIVSVKVNGTICQPPSGCLVDSGLADAMEWVAAQPWIDIASVSIGIPANVPDQAVVHPEAARWVRATEAGAQRGLVIVNSAGNEPTPGVADYFDGPPWVIAVGGVEPLNRGEHTTAAKAIDIASNYSDHAPRHDTMDEMRWYTGTSVATPVAAGAIAHALGIIRDRAPALIVPAGALRDAVNASAHIYEVTDWDPRPAERNESLTAALFYTSLPVVAQAQVGWGYVNGSISEEIARRIIENDLAPPPGKEQAVLFQAEYQRAREEFWARYR